VSFLRTSLCLLGGALWITVAPAAGASRLSADEISEAESLIAQNCAMCHSVDLIKAQRLNAEQWQATTAKMAKWGTPLQADEAALIGSYLAQVQAHDRPEEVMVTVAESVSALNSIPSETHAVGVRERGAELFSKACAACHGPNAEGKIGPALRDRPVLGRFADWQQIITTGRHKMPAFNKTFNTQQLADMQEWVRSVSGPALSPLK
jgi:mono/diheme cytochrome c family protein